MDNRYNIIKREINKISTSPRHVGSCRYEAILHNENSNVKINLVKELSIKGDYNGHVANQIMVTVIIPLGDFAYDVFPHKDNLEMTLNLYEKDKLTRSVLYKAILVNDGANLNGVAGSAKKETLNAGDVETAEFQLVEIEVEIIRMSMVSGVYKDLTVESLLYNRFRAMGDALKVNGLPIKPVLNITPPDNKTVYPHIIIPTGIRLIDLPCYLQDTNYGVYQGDVGVYLTNVYSGINQYKTNIYIYPLYSMVKSDTKELIIYFTNNNQSKISDNNILNSNESVKIIANGVSTIATKQNKLIDKGNVITSSNPDNLLMFNSKVSDNNISYDKDSNIKSLALSKSDGLNSERYVGNEVNLFKHTSKIMSDSLDVVTIEWRYSDYRLLHPGMPVTFYYQDSNGMREMVGTLQGFFTQYSGAKKFEATSLILKLGDKE